MHRVPRRSSRHVSRCVAAGRGRGQLSRNCIPLARGWKAADDARWLLRLRPNSRGEFASSCVARSFALLFFFFEFTRLVSRRLSVDDVQSTPWRRHCFFFLSLTVRHSRTRRFHASHDLSRRGSRLASMYTRHTAKAHLSHCDTMSCGERTVVCRTNTVELEARTTQHDGATAGARLQRRVALPVAARSTNVVSTARGDKRGRERGKARRERDVCWKDRVYRASNASTHTVPHANRRCRDPRAARSVPEDEARRWGRGREAKSNTRFQERRERFIYTFYFNTDELRAIHGFDKKRTSRIERTAIKLYLWDNSEYSSAKFVYHRTSRYIHLAGVTDSRHYGRLWLLNERSVRGAHWHNCPAAFAHHLS